MMNNILSRIIVSSLIHRYIDRLPLSPKWKNILKCAHLAHSAEELMRNNHPTPNRPHQSHEE